MAIYSQCQTCNGAITSFDTDEFDRDVWVHECVCSEHDPLPGPGASRDDWWKFVCDVESGAS